MLKTKVVYAIKVGSQYQRMACNVVLSPLSTAPWAYTSQRDNEICNLLERNENHRPIHNKVMQIWEALCVNLVGLYTLNGKDGSSIDFMALTMIDPASSWFEVEELPTITRLRTRTVNGKEKVIEEESVH